MSLFHRISNGVKPLLAHWRLLPIAMLATGVIVLAAVLYLILVGLERDTWHIRAEYRANVPWYATQFERELSVFVERLDSYHLGERGVTLSAVMDRFDVFWSRVSSADAGTVGSLYLRFEGAETLIEEARRALRDIEQTVASLEPDDAIAHDLIKARLEGLSERFHKVSLLALHQQGQDLTRHFDHMGQVHNLLMAIFAGVLTGSAILIGLILVEIRQIGALRDSLEQRVQDRTRDLRDEIVQRQQAVEALQESEARFQDFAGAASDWFWELGPDLRFSYLSERFEQSTGISPRQIIGKHHDEVSRPDTRDDVWIGHVEDMNAQRQFRDFRLVHMRNDGTTVHVSLSGTPRHDEAGNFTGFRGTGTNITEQVEAERALRRSEERYRRLVDLSSDGILIHVQENIVFANPAAARFLGARNGDDLVGRNLLELIDPKHHKATKLRIKDTLTRGQMRPRMEQIFVGLDGRRFPVHCASTQLPREGSRTILTVFRDTSQATQMEDSSRPRS
jgi:PAS domain S-box-containing protein